MSESTDRSIAGHVPLAGSLGAAYFGPARVLETDRDGARIHVMLSASDDEASGSTAPRSVWAERAMPFECTVGWGDCVLVAGNDFEELYVIGVIGAPKTRASSDRKVQSIELASGLRAESPDGASLAVYAADGRVLFEHNSESGKSRIDLPDGDVEFVAHSGNIDFVAAEKIRFTSRDEIQLSSLSGVRIAAHDALKQATSVVNVTSRKVAMTSDDLELQARTAALFIDETNFRGKRLNAVMQSIKSIAKRSESHVETLIERAKNSYRSVQSLSQLKAGRSRTIVDGTYELRSKDAFLKSDEDFKIDGEKIHLG